VPESLSEKGAMSLTYGENPLRGKPFWKRVFPLNPRHRGSLFPKIFKSFGKMAWKKPFFKRVSSKISARMLNLMTLSKKGGEEIFWDRLIHYAVSHDFSDSLLSTYPKSGYDLNIDAVSVVPAWESYPLFG
jgi:hypothetical protein